MISANDLSNGPILEAGLVRSCNWSRSGLATSCGLETTYAMKYLPFSASKRHGLPRISVSSVPFTHVTMTYVTYKHGVSLWPMGICTTYIKIDFTHNDIFPAKNG